MSENDSKHKSPGNDLLNSVEWLKQTVAKIRALNISADPKNYTLWYEYFSGRNPELNKELESSMKRQGGFTEEVATRLYNRFIIGGCERQRAEMRQAIRALLKQISEELKDFGLEISQYEDVLESCETQISTEEDPDVKTLGTVVDTLIAETKRCRSASSEAMAMVDAANAQIEEMNRELKQLNAEAMEDALTGIPNRRAFDLEISSALERADSSKPFCLLMLDIDHFKLVNDQHGHLVGDRVLRYVAEMIKRAIKGQDFVARFGGEEFAVLLPDTGYDGGLCVANSILKKVATRKLTVDKSGKPLGKVTLSGGLTLAHASDTLESLIERADNLLYEAKTTGRNTIKGDQS